MVNLLRACIDLRKIGLLFFVVSVFSETSVSQSNRPNIIYIMADDLGYADLSCYGRKDYTTPNIDKLASQGIKFLHAYSGAPLCTPTRVAFMTGRYPARTEVGLYEPLRATPKDSLVGLKADHPSVATFLKKAGYETALIGKWHLGFTPETGPNANGFSEFFGFHSGAIDYVSHKNPFHHPDLYENLNRIEKQGYFTDLISERASQYISRSHSAPFFLSIQFNAPHWPWQGPGDKPYADTMNYIRGGSPAVYSAMMRSLDSAVGAIVKAVEEAGLSNNTVIIFTSDNGGERYSDMGIYSGAKTHLKEGGLRVPAFIRWPGKIKPNSTTNQVAVTMDWTATIIAISGAKSDPKFPLDGENLLPVLTGQKPIYDRTLYWRMFQSLKQKAIRDGKWKYLQNEQGEHLYDLSVDPSEKNNLKDSFPEVFEKLRGKYAAWEKTVLKPIPL
jgi:arylsulfatase A-like enzyme